MKIVLNRFAAVLRVTRLGVKRSNKVVPEKAMEEKSITSAPIVPVVWIMLGLLLSVVTQTGLDNQRDRK